MTTKSLRKINLTISGMTCASCVAHVEEALKGVPGVEGATVNLATGKAAVEYDPSVTVVKGMKHEVEAIGYDVVPDVVQWHVLGMMGGHCEEIIKKAPADAPGGYRAG